jgi:Protein of unknown function (DUF3558)
MVQDVTIRRSHWITIVLGAVLLTGLTGCDTPPNVTEQTESPPSSSAAAAASPTALPPRPAELRLDGVNPCDLLAKAQQADLGVGAGTADNGTDELASPGCQWTNPTGSPDNNWVAKAVVKRGADAWLRSFSSAQVVLVDGFPTVQASSEYSDPGLECVLYVDVADGQSLSVEYINRRGDLPNINHGVACQKATAAAQLMLGNLRKKAHGN